MTDTKSIGFGTIFIAVFCGILWADLIINPPDIDMNPAKQWVGEVVEDNVNKPDCFEGEGCSMADLAGANLHLFIPGIIGTTLIMWGLGPSGKRHRRKLWRRGV